ncbi:MAG: carbohydrate binding domain-containing protein, partial [Prevotella sp.]
STWEVKSLKVSAGAVEEIPDTPVDGVILDQDFSSSLGKFTSVSVSGELKWYNDFSSAMITGYQDFDGDGKKENQPGVTFLVSPELNLTGIENAHVTINHALNYERGDINDNNTILISKNFSGDVNTATWEALTYDTDGLNKSFAFVEKSINIPASYIGSKVVIALRHTCTETQSSTWEVKKLTVKAGEAGGEDNPDEGDVNTPNGDFETWVDGKPNNWSTASTAGNATLTQSTDAHGGKYSVQVGGTSSANKRLGYKETELKAGEYTMTFYAKAATATGASVRPGFVPVTDGKAGTYNYGDYTNNITNGEWVKVTHTFNIEADGTYCIVVMNSKNPGADVLIDDFTLESNGTMIIK